MMESTVFECDDADAGVRIDSVVKKHMPSLSRKHMKELFAGGRIRRNGRVAKKGVLVRLGDSVEVQVAEQELSTELLAKEGPLEILFENDLLIVVDKERGMPTHPLRGDETNTLLNRVVASRPEVQGLGYGGLESGILHRLDTNTSGVLVCAKTQDAFDVLSAELKRSEWQKEYVALSHSSLPFPLIIDASLDASEKRVRVDHDGKPSLTWVVGCEPVDDLYALVVECHRATRHQVRVHLATMGAPIFGDALYGGVNPDKGHFLHARSVGFTDPATQQWVKVESRSRRPSLV